MEGFSHETCCIDVIVAHMWAVSGIKSCPKYAHLRSYDINFEEKAQKMAKNLPIIAPGKPYG